MEGGKEGDDGVLSPESNFTKICWGSLVSEEVEVEEAVEEEREVRMTTVFAKAADLARIVDMEDGAADTVRRMEFS